MRPRLLLAIPQLPQDPTSGAARTAQTACEMAAAAGWDVRAIGPTATEGVTSVNAVDWLRSLQLDVRIDHGNPKNGRRIQFHQRGIDYTLIDTGNLSPQVWETKHSGEFDRLFEEEIRRHRPDVVLTYGGHSQQLKRLRRAKHAGCKIAFCVFNMGYLVPGFFDLMDSVLTPSEWLANYYHEKIGLKSTPLPTPVEPDDVLAGEREPIFLTMINPSVEKGLFFLARLAEELGVHHPQIPFLAIESRGTAGMLTEAGRLGGFDLQRHENLMFAPATPNPKDIYQPTRVLLVPSVWEEASGRVAAEALMNGVPPIVSDRGGLAESCNGAGFVLPLPADLTLESRVPVGPAAVAPWLELIGRLFEDEAFYSEQSARAITAATMYRRETLAPRYVDFFEKTLL
jgi:glycosyltransferase involved in cell wall biosynthesis